MSSAVCSFKLLVLTYNYKNSYYSCLFVCVHVEHMNEITRKRKVKNDQEFMENILNIAWRGLETQTEIFKNSVVMIGFVVFGIKTTGK